MSRPAITKESLLKNTIMLGGCWVYQGIPNAGGYCRVKLKGRKVYIHRLSAHLHWGFDLDSPTLILHKVACTHPNCWNPEHLYEGTNKDNALDQTIAGTHAEMKRTHCSEDHPLDGVRGNGKRYCLTCNRLRAEWNRL